MEAYFAFETKEKAVAFETYLKTGSGHAFAKRHFWLSHTRPAWKESKPLKSPFSITFTDLEGDLTRFQIPLKRKVEFA